MRHAAMTDRTIDRDYHRSLAAQEAAAIRRRLAEVQVEERMLRHRVNELEYPLAAATALNARMPPRAPPRPRLRQIRAAQCRPQTCATTRDSAPAKRRTSRFCLNTETTFREAVLSWPSLARFQQVDTRAPRAFR